MHHEEKEEKMVLGHDAVPGFKPVFLVVFTLSLIYLAFVFFQPVF